MMRESSNIMWLSVRSEAALESALPVPVVVHRLKTAKRLRLSLRRNHWNAEADLPMAGQSLRGSGLGAGSAAVDRCATRPGQAGRTFRAWRGDPRRGPGCPADVGFSRAPDARHERIDFALRRSRVRLCPEDRTIPEAPCARDDGVRSRRLRGGGRRQRDRCERLLMPQAVGAVARRAEPFA